LLGPGLQLRKHSRLHAARLAAGCLRHGIRCSSGRSWRGSQQQRLAQGRLARQLGVLQHSRPGSLNVCSRDGASVWWRAGQSGCSTDKQQ
jgi:hypothetical protein